MRTIWAWPLSTFDVEPGSSFLPKKGGPQDEILNRRFITLDLTKSAPVDLPSEAALMDRVINKQDVDLRWMADGNNDDRSAAFSLTYSMRDGSLEQWASFLKPIVWKDSGKITSVPDLAGASITITWSNLRDSHLELECLWLEVSKGRFIDISGTSLRRYSIPNFSSGAPVYTFTFPQSLNDLKDSCAQWHP